MRNSLKAVLFGAFSVMFSAGLHAETHQHGDMNAASDASVQQVIKGTGVVKDIDMNSKDYHFARSNPCCGLACNDHALHFC